MLTQDVEDRFISRLEVELFELPPTLSLSKARSTGYPFKFVVGNSLIRLFVEEAPFQRGHPPPPPLPQGAVKTVHIALGDIHI